ncbi:hypothetical protein FSARC_12294 [Fusarium sarcochroum]|uniref:Kynurenine formamidase n=1 Tax=Fusarium sarcochroum TaxID=1208366 RepID=A0A8H4T9Q7_9HYPO|nr:hypothetical protein FSARC_12294 [Fusarium sarcochroum]
MLSFLRSADPPRTTNADNNPIFYENERSSVTFASPDSHYIMTHRIPPTDKENGISIIVPPFHYHIYQDEFFHVRSGKGHFYRGINPEPFAILSDDGQATASVKAGRYHRFENATTDRDLVVDIHLSPESYENEQQFFRNFFGYLDDFSWALVGDSNPILHKRRVPYIDGTYLQTLDIWVPTDNIETDGSLPHPSTGIPPRQVDSSSFEFTALKLLERNRAEKMPSIAGIASLNYRLSQHPHHPTHPSPPRDSSVSPDEARMAKHPDHIRDVLSGLSYLNNIGALSGGYILAGHSCGAFLAFQAVMNQSRLGLDPPITIKKPDIVVGLNGLYDLPAFLSNPDPSHEHMVPICDAFTRGAFGEDIDKWPAVCPTVVDDWKTEWPEGRKVVLAQSYTDELVPHSQTDIMKRNLTSSGTHLAIQEVPVVGKHNELWQRPEQLVEMLLKIVHDFN